MSYFYDVISVMTLARRSARDAMSDEARPGTGKGQAADGDDVS